MTPEEFDIDFDFDKEYGYLNDPIKQDEDDDFDLDAALARELGPDFDEQFEKEYAAAQAALNASMSLDNLPADDEDDLDKTRFFGSFSHLDDADEELDDAEDGLDELTEVLTEKADEAPAPAADMPAAADDSDDENAVDAADLDAVLAAVAAAQAAAPLEEAESAIQEEEMPAAEEDTPPIPRRERRQSPKKNLDLKAITDKIDTEAIGARFSAAGQVIAENGRNFVSALKECKPGKMDKKQKRRFKNDVLPILIGGAACLMCLIFIVGALGRSLNSEERREAARLESIAQAEAEAAAAAEITNTLSTAARQAAMYDYQAAIATLDSYKDPETGRELTEEMAAARVEYEAAGQNLVVWDDPTAITNLSFHMLVADAERAYADNAYRKSYQTNFITVHEFSGILEDLYDNGYVLVNLDSCISESEGADGKVTYTTKPIYLPEGKTPIMITETLVNYFDYMLQSGGFASRLVIKAGQIEAEYVDAEGETQVGDYDLVPVLDSFIEAHPDFSYRNAKAILAVTGDEGVFGWRTSTDESLIDGAKDVVEVLRANGYQIASNSYANLDYSGSTTAAQITEDLQKWEAKVAPVLGDLDIMVIAKGGGIRTRGTGFKLMEEAGFHYILDSTDTPGAELNAEYFHQHRLMVTGADLESGIYDAYFDALSIMDAAR